MDLGNLGANYLLGGAALVAAGLLALWGLGRLLAAWRGR